MILAVKAKLPNSLNRSYKREYATARRRETKTKLFLEKEKNIENIFEKDEIVSVQKLKDKGHLVKGQIVKNQLVK